MTKTTKTTTRSDADLLDEAIANVRRLPEITNEITNDGEEITCENCGEIVYQGGDGDWFHTGTISARCWPGRNFRATPEAV